MGKPAAKEGDRIEATDTHVEIVPGPTPPVPVPHRFVGTLDRALSNDVYIQGKSAACKNSLATNSPPHIPKAGIFQVPPGNEGKVIQGSATVFINSRPAARDGDTALTCNDPADLPAGRVVARGSVYLGD